MTCAYECHQIGGPWVAENPSCPIHGAGGIRDDLERMEDMQAIIKELTEALDGYVEAENNDMLALIERAKTFW